MQELTRPENGEGRSGGNGKSELGSIRPAGVLATAWYVQGRLMCSVGGRPTRGKVRAL
jgi:hypothetical protein